MKIKKLNCVADARKIRETVSRKGAEAREKGKLLMMESRIRMEMLHAKAQHRAEVARLKAEVAGERKAVKAAATV